MTQFLTVLKSTSRAAVVALALGGVALTAMPAQAAGPNFSIQLGGGGFGIQLNNGNNYNKKKYDYSYFDEDYCMNDKQVRKALYSKGWDDVKVGDDYDDLRVIVVASWDDVWYKMRVNRCTGKVDKVQKLKKPKNNNFSLYLNLN